MTQDDLENTTITLRDVQAVLLSMFNAESILIGHSLESDLFALKVHPNIRAARLIVKKKKMILCIKSLKNSYRNIQICIYAAADTERAVNVTMFR